MLHCCAAAQLAQGRDPPVSWDQRTKRVLLRIRRAGPRPGTPEIAQRIDLSYSGGEKLRRIMAGEEGAELKGLSKYFNSQTYNGRANKGQKPKNLPGQEF
ncbi:hypothetical protein MSG28_000206 [Choristoneura fumiferana]|uniref:Uncharacterized protein n=1 Tax=Choristoneura fumiferana TaxID=7141 RepID=A0ACC0K078_CHOFU|nr:hypothetical protein MSG28_000206 [Choristoneura fumiferana]